MEKIKIEYFCVNEPLNVFLTVKNVKSFIDLILSLEWNTSIWNIKDSFLKLELFERENISNIGVYYFKATINNKLYFVKHCLSPTLLWVGWYEEAISNYEAQSILFDNNIFWAEIIKFKFWYTDSSNRYYISEWYENKNSIYLDLYLKKIKNKLGESDIAEKDKELLNILYLELIENFKTLKNLFKNFFDFHEYNIFIDTETKKMFLFDLTKR